MNESAVYEIRLKDSFSGPLRGLESKMSTFEGKVGGLKSSFGSLGTAIAGAFTTTAIISGVTAIGSKIVKLGAEMEQTRVSFETMLGSSEAASGLIKQLQQFANVTPYVTSEVLDAGKQMLAFGFNTTEVIPQLTRLGDVASGLNIPLGDMIYLFGTLKTQGKAMTKDIMQFAQRGIPIYDALAEVLHVNKTKVGEFVTAGKVGFNEVSKAFELMTKKGSKFGGMMDKQSKTLAGRWSTFEGILETIGVQLGERMLPTLGKIVDALTDFANILPRLDFSSLEYATKEYLSSLEFLGETLKDMISLFGLSADSMSLMQFAVQGLALAARVATTPLRLMVDVVRILVNTVKSAAPIFGETANLLHSVFTMDVMGAKDSVNRMKALIVNFGSTVANTFADIGKGEFEGWKNIFKGGHPKKEEDADSMASARAKAGMTGAGLEGKPSGVEKVSSGMRNVVVNITKLVETVNISKAFGKQSDSELVDAVKKALLTAVNDVNIVAQ